MAAAVSFPEQRQVAGDHRQRASDRLMMRRDNMIDELIERPRSHVREVGFGRALLRDG
jgi:hypothetical protein